MDECTQKQAQSPLALTELEKTRWVDLILSQVAEARAAAEAKGELFSGLTEEEIRERLNRVNTPMITSQGWSGSTASPGTISYSVGIFNPDPVSRIWMYTYAFVGPANPVPDTGVALLNVDTRFPRLAQPSFPGLTLAPGASASLSFSLSVPAGIQASNYLGNTFLFHGEYHGIGAYYDRGFWPFRVT